LHTAVDEFTDAGLPNTLPGLVHLCITALGQPARCVTLRVVIRSIDVSRSLMAEKGIVVGPRTSLDVVNTLLSPDSLRDDLVLEIRGKATLGEVMDVVVTALELRDAIRRLLPSN
jgi:hypothetical protein